MAGRPLGNRCRDCQDHVDEDQSNRYAAIRRPTSRPGAWAGRPMRPGTRPAPHRNHRADRQELIRGPAGIAGWLTVRSRFGFRCPPRSCRRWEAPREPPSTRPIPRRAVADMPRLGRSPAHRWRRSMSRGHLAHDREPANRSCAPARVGLVAVQMSRARGTSQPRECSTSGPDQPDSHASAGPPGCGSMTSDHGTTSRTQRRRRTRPPRRERDAEGSHSPKQRGPDAEVAAGIDGPT